MSNTIKDHEDALNSMATPEFTTDLVALLRSRAPLIYLVCNEEKRMKAYFKHLSAVRGYKITLWDCFRGPIDLNTGKKSVGVTDELSISTEMLSHIIEQAEQDETNAKALKSQNINGNIFILLDFHRFLEDGDPDLERRLKTFANIESMTHIVMTGPYLAMTPAIEDNISVLDFPFPNTKEIEKSLDTLVAAVQKQGKLPELPKETENKKNELIKAANGLTLNEAQMAFSKSIVIHKRFEIPTILKEKEQIIRKKGTLEFCSSKFNVGDVGGLDTLIAWLKKRKNAFHSDAFEYGLPAPRGALLVGLPGCVFPDTKIKVRKISNKGKLKIYKKQN